MKVLALLGSPRRDGNTEILADAFLEGAEEAGAEADKVRLDALNIRPIGEVIDVSNEREDVRADDDYPAALERFMDADVAVFATPVYWLGVSGQMKCFIDRFSCYFNRPECADRFTGKGYVVLCTYGCDEPNHGRWVTEPLKVAVNFLRGEYLGDVCASAYKKGAIREQPDVLDAARALGRECVARMSEATDGGE